MRAATLEHEDPAGAADAGPAAQRTPTPIKAAFLYHSPRDRLLADVAAGNAPDTGLVGSNHLPELGIDASVRTPSWQLERRGGFLRRVARNARELRAPWEVADTQVTCSFWVKFFPLVARLRGGPSVVAFNVGLCTTYLRASSARRRLMSESLRSAAAVICFASAQRERLLTQHELDPDRVHAVRFGVDHTFYRPRVPPSDGYLLAVGADVARDYDTFVRAIDGIDARAIVVGNARNLADVKAPPNLELKRNVSYLELRELYAGAACVVLPTRRDGFPYGADCSGQTVLLDAMAMGRPVVASERATLSDYVSDEETALLVPPEDPDSLRDALERVLGDRSLSETMGRAGRLLVEDDLTTRDVARRLAPIIGEAAGHPPRRAGSGRG